MNAVQAYNKAVKKGRPQSELKRLERAVKKLKRECGKAKAKLDTARANQRKSLKGKGSGGGKEPNVQTQQLIMSLENKLRNLQEQFRVEKREHKRRVIGEEMARVKKQLSNARAGLIK